MKLRTVVFTLILFQFVSSAYGATVYLKGGGELTGTVVSQSSTDIQLNTSNGTVRIGMDKVDRIDYTNQNQAQPPQQQPQQQAAPQAPPGPPGWRRVYVRRPTYNFQNMRHELSFDLGVAAPLSNVDFSAIGGGSDTDGDTGILLGLQYLYYLDPHWAAGFDFHFFDRSTGESTNQVPFSFTDISGDSEVFLGLLKYVFLPYRTTRPYISAGAGVARTAETIDATPQPGFVWGNTNTNETRRLLDDSSWGFASSARFGVDFTAFDPTFISIELGWTGLFDRRYSPTIQGQQLGLGNLTGALNVFTAALRWGWRF